MADREKVIRGLEMCLADEYCDGCPYEEDCFDPDIDNPWGSGVMRDALALLKERVKTKVVFGRNKDGSFETECGNCGTYLDKAYSRCPKCNRELDWNSNQT